MVKREFNTNPMAPTASIKENISVKPMGAYVSTPGESTLRPANITAYDGPICFLKQMYNSTGNKIADSHPTAIEASCASRPKILKDANMIGNPIGNKELGVLSIPFDPDEMLNVKPF
ncbi:hypothetical protein W01_06580 [Candidatus Nitrotoga sp. AM1P]|nr:hypothetical protein W01_06580 [Candidatus Nitrotoga sp. AM1P]